MTEFLGIIPGGAQLALQRPVRAVFWLLLVSVWYCAWWPIGLLLHTFSVLDARELRTGSAL